MRRLLALLAIVLTVATCSEPDTRTGLRTVLPQPTLVPTSEIVAESERVYYMVPSAERDVIAEAEQILLTLLEDQIPVLNAWLPSSASTCACVICVACIVIELQMPDRKILNHGFLDDAEGWVCNCGVDGMWLYRFG